MLVRNRRNRYLCLDGALIHIEYNIDIYIWRILRARGGVS